MGELERSHIDRNSPIWGGSDCDYYDLSLEVESYWIGFFKNELNLITVILSTLKKKQKNTSKNYGGMLVR